MHAGVLENFVRGDRLGFVRGALLNVGCVRGLFVIEEIYRNFLVFFWLITEAHETSPKHILGSLVIGKTKIIHELKAPPAQLGIVVGTSSLGVVAVFMAVAKSSKRTERLIGPDFDRVSSLKIKAVVRTRGLAGGTGNGIHLLHGTIDVFRNLKVSRIINIQGGRISCGNRR